MNKLHEFRLTTTEIQLMRRCPENDDAISWAFNIIDGNTIRLNREAGELLCDHLTLQLAKVGFGELDEPNTEGRMIEELIGKLFIP